MGQRSQALAEQFEQANREVIATIERCSDAQWKLPRLPDPPGG